MHNVRLALCALVAAAVLAGCEEKFDVPAADTATAGEASPDGAAPAATAPAQGARPVVSSDTAPIEPVSVAADAVRVGTAVDANGAATAGKPVYGVGDTIHASLAAAGRSGKAKVYWSGENGLSVEEEEKAITGANVDFAFSRADGMVPGKYNVEIDVDGVPAGIVDFSVQ
ncbi:MAG: hypothetical protein ACTHOC_10910 [Luteimonas sp.]